MNASVPVINALSPNPIIPKSLTSPSLMAHIMTRKYIEALSLYLQKKGLNIMAWESACRIMQTG